ncbi:MAG: replication-associated recombination protein A [Bacteroidia bacterium]|jgi:putative ATPase|nr:replication-associated recombination protein A [Bacteroidia bacterium]
MEPLAERIRPKKLEHYLGQTQIIGKGSALRSAIENNLLPSLIFWGPPGVGKTSLALIIANELKRPFYSLSAINSGVKDIREVIEKADSKNLFNQIKPVLFIDEIHRFSKSQQDSLLGAVEKGVVTLIGATTENPSFEVIPALLSRCQVYVLKTLEKKDLLELLNTAIKTDVVLSKKNIDLLETDALLRISGGDARKLLNALEITVNSVLGHAVQITNELVQHSIQQNLAVYDKSGEQHYDIISAFIKSMRGSDPNAALYYLARMLKGGEDPLFIARRMLVLASEDIGNANPNALLMATACFQSVNVIGMPEGRILLAQCASYLACSPKSNASYMGIETATETVEKTGDLSVPLHLRNAPTELMKELNYGKDYQYAHSFESNFVELEFLPEELSGTKFYEPGNNSREIEQRNYLKRLWKDKYEY